MPKLTVWDKEFGLLNYEGIPVVSSRTVGDVFGKKHKNVLRDIRGLIERVEQSEERMGSLDGLRFEPIYFYQSTYVDERNREKPEYLLTKDGFTLLSMEYTTENAMDFKLAYMRKYNEMERYLENLFLCRSEYPELTQAIKFTRRYPKPADFAMEADLINHTVLGCTAKDYKKQNGLSPSLHSIRPHLSATALEHINALQRVSVGLQVAEPYNYKKRKQLLEKYFAKITDPEKV